ncbi:MAG TPA: phospho-sugar mutase [Candidatus Saccharibacteria bacterium]|jgi:phosphoglucomutase|nr:phospho-sugar mutase [Candidatus Saccharibacteria bacterium]
MTDNNPLSENAKQNISDWLSGEKFEFYKKELELLIERQEWTVLEDAFFRVLPFGTGGRRGTCGIGSNRINRVTIGETVQALCDYLKSQVSDSELKIAIAYDSRLTSKDFAQYSARVIAGNAMHAYLFDGPRATPELSFTLRDGGFDAGIVITASHNPSSDNGIKLYWRDGGQLVAPHDSNVLSIAAQISEIRESGADSSFIHALGVAEDERYWSATHTCLFDTEREISIAYSPLHGTGITSVYPSLQKAGFRVKLLDAQAEMNGSFPNVTNHIPNPEVPIANDKLVAFALQEGCDLATSNDPDADRYCVLVAHNGGMVQLTGNQAGVLMADYVLSSLQKKEELTDKHFVCSTIVTTDMFSVIAKSYGVQSYTNLLVGFKYIGEQMNIRHDTGEGIFVCGIEESYGGVIGDYCRDKDAAGPTIALAECAARLKKQGQTLIDKLDELFETHGVFLEDLHSVTFPGAEGFAQMQQFMSNLRMNTPQTLGGTRVLKVRDYSDGIEIKDKCENVLRFELSEDAHDRITIRPSGTEPKLKLYVQAHAAKGSGDLTQMRAMAQSKIDSYKVAVLSLLDH